MIGLQIADIDEHGMDILFLGAHSDDIEIGCGGTVLNLLKKYKIGKIVWVVFCSNENRKKEAIASAEKFLDSVNNKEIRVMSFRDGFLPDVWSDVKEEFESVKREFNPDLIFTHTRDDRHQDHRIVSDLTWNTFRNHMILEYEIPKYDGDLSTPSLYVEIDGETADRKKSMILESFQSQQNKHWLDAELLSSLMRIRGVECVSKSGYAEGFYVRKMVLK
jgi:LmbE family N-acetylglucosaminyl deacetylase